jgi:hypothetical protein
MLRDRSVRMDTMPRLRANGEHRSLTIFVDDRQGCLDSAHAYFGDKEEA